MNLVVENQQLVSTIIRLYEATGGQVLFNGEDVHGKKSRAQLERSLTVKCK